MMMFVCLYDTSGAENLAVQESYFPSVIEYR